TLMRNIMSDIKVELCDEFDRNFTRKAFFNKKWVPPKKPKRRGSLLITTGAMRRSIRATIRGHSLCFSSAKPYTALHNSGGVFSQRVREHSRTHRKSKKSYTVRGHTRNANMPQRQFIGDSPEVQTAIKAIISENLYDYFNDLATQIRK
ncbi:MAG: phage virion morphogenesis protein, partial [Muribaculaceae bacterium]